MIGIISHDSGGAEILSSWVAKNIKKKKFIFSLSGPAKKIFKKKIKLSDNNSLNYVINNSKSIVTGTSWPNKNEIKAIRLSKKKKIFCASYIDHWVNYKDRFFYNKRLYLPDEIWVGDNIAKKIAKKTFKKAKIRYVKNEFFEYIKKKYKKNKNSKKILILSTPIIKDAKLKFDDPMYFGFTEFDAIELAINKIENLNFEFKKIVIRPHPSESPKKFRSFINKNISISKEKDVLKDISSSDIVIGYNSMAMILAKIMKKKVFSCIPRGKIKNTLPFKMNDL